MQQGNSLLLQVTCTTTELTALNSRLASAAAKCLALTEQVCPALCWLTSPALLLSGQTACTLQWGQVLLWRGPQSSKLVPIWPRFNAACKLSP